MKIKKGIAAWDIHYPYHDDRCMKILLDFTNYYKPDVFILGGDQLDMDMISSFNKHKPLKVEGKRLKKHYNGFEKTVLKPINDCLSNNCKKYFIIGNHERRVQWYVEEYPQMEGYAEIENNLDLSGWEIVPFNQSVGIGDMRFIHGHYCNKYHTQKTLGVYDENIYYGHVHSAQSFSKTTPIKNEPKEARCIGCLCNKNPEYKVDMPNSWVNEFMFFEWLDDGRFFPHIARIIDGVSVINGTVYEG